MLTDTWKAALGEYLFRGTEPEAPPANLYVALFTADPIAAGNLDSEVDADEYGRQPYLCDAPSTPGEYENNDDIEFPESVDGWSPITHVCLMTVETGGTVDSIIDNIALPSPVNVNAGIAPVVPVGGGRELIA